MFGAGDAALMSVRNGLIMNHVIEGAFDSSWVTIVPDGSPEESPTEWRMILLSEAQQNQTIYTEPETGKVMEMEGKILQSWLIGGFINNSIRISMVADWTSEMQTDQLDATCTSGMPSPSFMQRIWVGRKPD